MTIIVTTHYIEEARQANIVGLMRSGRMLAQDSPDRLLNDFNCETLEDVFLKLCLADKENRQIEKSKIVKVVEPAAAQESGDNNMNILQPKEEVRAFGIGVASSNYDFERCIWLVFD